MDRRLKHSNTCLSELGHRTLVMGILNVTPDSFSDGGQFDDVPRALEKAHRMVELGADIIDIGGESTRPGFQVLSADQEWARLEPILGLLCEQVDVPISVDTYKSKTAERALQVGVKIVNDVWGGRFDEHMFEVVARYDASYILMHNNTDHRIRDGDIMEVVKEELLSRMEVAVAAGVRRECIILDPGIGFGKTVEQNLSLINHLDALTSLGYPILIGTSRKSIIGKILDLPVHDRVEGTAATVAVGIARGASIVRVHDVLEMARIAKMTDALVR